MLLSLGLTLVLASSAFAAPQCHTSELLKCADFLMDYMHSLPKRSLPSTLDEVNSMCQSVGSALDCAMNFRDNCLTPLQKELLGLVIEGVVDSKTSFCAEGSSTKESYLKHGPCLNELAHKDEFKDKIDYMLAFIEQVHKKKSEEKLTYVCCGLANIYHGYANMTTAACGKEAKDTTFDLFSMAVAQLPEVLCTGFDGTEARCKAVLPPDGAKPANDGKELEIFKFIKRFYQQWLE